MQHPTKEQIHKAAETSPEAKAALSELYPELFTKVFKVDEGYLISRGAKLIRSSVEEHVPEIETAFLEVRGLGEYQNRALFIARGKEADDNGVLVLTHKSFKPKY